MAARPTDATEDAWRVVEDGIAKMTPEQRFGRAVSLTILAHGFALAGIRRMYPDEDERQHRLRLAGRYLDPELMKTAFGWSS